MEERNSFAKVEVGDRDAERKRYSEQIRDFERQPEEDLREGGSSSEDG